LCISYSTPIQSRFDETGRGAPDLRTRGCYISHLQWAIW